MRLAAFFTLALASAALADEPSPFPADIGGPFELIDHNGALRSEADPEGRMQLLFFGYANCPSICAAALPLMGQVTEMAAERGIAVSPLMITIDGERDSPEAMRAALAKIHPALIGLTGSDAALKAARRQFHVQKKLVYEDPFDGPIYAHGSYIYLLDGGGNLLTLIPPVLSPARIAEILARYAQDIS